MAAEMDMEGGLEKLDINHDGKVSYEELLVHGDDVLPTAVEHNSERFNAADANKDGNLTREELNAYWYPETNDAVLTVVTSQDHLTKDVNDDGKLNPREYFETDHSEGPDEEDEEFKKYDQNGDGFLDIHELKKLRSGEADTHRAMTELVQIADKNKDGAIAQPELNNATVAGTESMHDFLEWASLHKLWS
eukprot:CAMPEP_0197688332 /NCGR_PEP_ID=MMETSP1338-20131121/105266_1 /TAXON_ID=43686 ORGANISM="Pelagodinium beii, Strain RCC1491" /NCGR_SAMPLE_ID=MMETSP1338 /ASSEMBLY_ACC=CAM_ASM_000754 /LENGTH=190 /DNA_ID=CAMNT_0043270525 /DNA_START=1 /DNA_END=570 /DNA_ORIENTATION=+